MPNWCENTLIITPHSSEQSRLDEYIEDMINQMGSSEIQQDRRDLYDAFYFNYILPLNDGDVPSSVWGTKWEPANVQRYDEYSWCFDTAWSPPSGIILQLSRLFPLSIIGVEYQEPGMDFAGVFVCMKGKSIIDESWDFSKYCPDDEDEGWDWEAYNNKKPHCIDKIMYDLSKSKTFKEMEIKVNYLDNPIVEE